MMIGASMDSIAMVEGERNFKLQKLETIKFAHEHQNHKLNCVCKLLLVKKFRTYEGERKMNNYLRK
jgi:hypothetical protein